MRAHRWRRRIEIGQAKSITDLAEQEGVKDAYVCRLLPLTCLAPDIVEVILDGRQPKGLRLAELLGNGPLAWEEQRMNWCSGSPRSCLASSPAARRAGSLRHDHDRQEALPSAGCRRTSAMRSPELTA